MYLDGEYLDDAQENYSLVDSLSFDGPVEVQYPDGALWLVLRAVWTKLNNA